MVLLVYAKETAVVYTVPEIMNAVSYEWILPVGVVGSSNTNTIELDFSDLAVSGDISVKGINECGECGISSIYVNINEIPTISLVSTNCSADLKTYSVEFTANIGNVSVDVGNIDENRIFDIPVGTDITIAVTIMAVFLHCLLSPRLSMSDYSFARKSKQ